ncbi:MAG: ATP-binding protein [Leptospirales bacterium]
MRRVKNQPANTVINLTRVVFSAILVYTALTWDLYVLSIVLIIGQVGALLWLVLTESVLEENRYPVAAYFPTTLDLFIITVFIYFSGTANSLMAAGYVFSVSLCSLNTKIRQGLYATVVSIISYVTIVLLVYLEWMPPINVFGGTARVTLANLLFAYFFIPTSIVLIHLLVHGLVVRNEALIEDVRAAGEAKMEFLANMSHEIRTPLNAILGVADLLKESQLNQEQVKLVNVFRKSGRLLLQIVNDILDFAKIEAREIRLQDTPFDPEQVLRDVFDTYRLAASEKGLVLLQSIEAPGRYECFGDPDRLNQILGNLVGNAVKFTERGEIEIGLAIKVTGGDAFVRYKIRDTGIGISPEDMSSLFGSFVQVQKRSAGQVSHRPGGTGLGLAISQELARLMGGRIAATSEPGRGSEFIVELNFSVLRELPPGEEDEQAFAGQAPGSPESESSGTATAGVAVSAVFQERTSASPMKRILIAEDAEENRFLLEHYLKNQPHQIIYAENGEQAVAIFEEQHFDLIFMDLQMPVLDGYEAIRMIREIEAKRGEAKASAANSGWNESASGGSRESYESAPEQETSRGVPIVALTAHAMRQDANRATDAGADHYLTKPISKTRFLKAIEDYSRV